MKRKAYMPVRIASAIVAAVVAICGGYALMPTRAAANSAVMEYVGSLPSGVILTDADCPVVVEREDLLFDLRDIDADDSVGADNFVRAAYTLRNPEEYDVTARLAFPFGSLPVYADYYDTHGYDVELNGETIDKRLRYTFTEENYYNYEFSQDRDLARLRDDYVRDEFFNADTAVFKHKCRANFDSIGLEHRLVTLENTTFTADCRVYCYSDRNDLHTGLLVEDGETFYIYTIGGGENFANDNSASFYKLADGAARLDDHTRTDGKLTVISSERMTADDLIFENYPADAGISRVDWYNAVQDQIDFSSGATRESEWISYGLFKLDRQRLMRWYDYEITIPANDTVVNAVTAPIYPHVDLSYDHAVHTYRYLLSPAECWADFSDLEITVLTPHYLIYSSVGAFDLTDDGYAARFSSLPSGELTIRTCAVQEPHATRISTADILWAAFILGAAWLAISVVGTIITAIVLAVTYSTRNNNTR